MSQTSSSSNSSSKPRKRPSYSDLSIDDVRKNFAITMGRVTFFQTVDRVQPSAWLTEVLNEGAEGSVVSEKARSEFIVAPILLYIKELFKGKISIYSGVKFDIDSKRGLHGVCDFILSKSPFLPTVQAPAFMLVEAKKNDIEEGLGQCAAEMVAAQLFNQREGNSIETIYGCVTNGESWQFLRLVGQHLEIDRNRYFINSPDQILGVFNTMVKTIVTG